MKRVLLFFCFAFGLSIVNAADRTLRWSSAGDVLTFDLDAASDTFSSNVGRHIYERSSDEAERPGSSRRLPPRGRFSARPDGASDPRRRRVSDGSPLTADDVVFSIIRSQHRTHQSRAGGASWTSED
jgi:hypothetical protein